MSEPSTPSASPLPFALGPDEQLLRCGRANMQRGAETVGGALYVTGERLVFVPHAVNVRGGTSELQLALIAGIATAWTRFLGVLPMFPNSIALTLHDGSVQSYVVTGRARWIAEIEQARGGGAVRV